MGTSIGEYNISFNKRSQYIYKTKSICTGYFIRKLIWKQIFSDNKEIAKVLKK